MNSKPPILAFDRKRASSNRTHYSQKIRPASQINCKEQVLELEKTVSILEQKKKNLLFAQKQFDNAMTHGELRRSLYNDFQNEINRFSERLQKRSDLLANFEEQLNTFRQYTDDLPPIPKEKLANFLSNSHNPQTKLLNENKVLVNQALAQERTMLVLKMKMRLCHDHRDLDQLRSVLNRMMGGGKDMDEDQIIIKKYKEVIGILKQHIKEEKARIEEVSKPFDVEHESAIIIQKTWRGYRYRQKKKNGTLTEEQSRVDTSDETDETTEIGEENPDEKSN